ncbi:hypothetical protein CPB83DRAFT_761068 [Crepidotus variabilis]|uniref:Uncharacterized protein n=1 Tax=Crepidotus variabilis TaxID=179855 RepID=A0A9P6JS62_9AGAR|nr:hypothetical protein CPB83DRAFT_761068 [Crepidotus variabilis]
MAAALQPIHGDLGNPSGPSSLYPSGIMNEFTFGDNRYPPIRPQSRATQQSNSRPGTSDRSWQPTPASSEAQSLYKQSSSGVYQTQAESQYQSSRQTDQRSLTSDNYLTQQQDQDSHKTSLSYALPPSSSRRVVERYSLDDNGQVLPPNAQRPPPFASEAQSVQETVTARSRPTTPQGPRVALAQGRMSPKASTSRRSTPPQGQISSSQFPPIIPLSASPTYTPPVAPTNRAYAQQPTYVNQSNGNRPIQPVYTPIVPVQEEVCVECAMRDQDMADVDVLSPGVWERESDVVFEELKRRELEEETAGIVSDDPKRPRIRGGRLTEQHVKLWLSINPREPASKQQTLHNYIKSQRALLEAEAHAHARAMQEAKQLDNRMRDAYSQLRRSAYDTGSTTSAIDDLGGVRIKPPVAAPLNHSRARSHSREVTLLENGMIVEHVDVKKEEREARERRKREDRRARKSSRSSVMDVGSIISAQSSGQVVDNNLTPYSRYSQANYSPRPASVFGLGAERPDLPRAYSQASFSDVHSLTSGSPRRTRFFGMKNLSTGWRSQDSLAPSGMSGSMVDMHLALQRDGYGPNGLSASPIDLNTPRRSQIWPPVDLEGPNTSQILADDKSKKKKGGLAKIWRIVTGKTIDQTKNVAAYQGQEDDLPLAPPPPLSYLVDRKPPTNDFSGNGGMRQTSSPSLPLVSPKYPMGPTSPGMSPPTAPSSILPSPASLRQSGDIEIAGMNDGLAYNDDTIRQDEGGAKMQNNWKSMQSLTSETDSRPQNSSGSPTPNDSNMLRPQSTLVREKSLPPLPVGEAPAQVLPTDRPRTYYGMDTHAVAPGPDSFTPPQAAFRNGDMRRQSFGGMSSRPNLNVQTMPVTQPVDFDARRAFNPRYDEFGASRRSLGRLDLQENSRAMSPPVATKRKSKFGLSSLLGKKQDKREQPELIYNHDLGPQYIATPYDPQDDMTTAGYATSTSRHSALSSGNPNVNARLSAPRRPLEELVHQDSEFLAYRYPSNDQRLDLLR